MYAAIIASTLCFITVFSYPAAAQESGKLDGTWLLGEDRETQKFFIQTSVVMAVGIAGQAHPEIHSCLEDWFPLSDERYDEVLSFMREFPDHVPTTIVIGVIQKHCGKFKES